MDLRDAAPEASRQVIFFVSCKKGSALNSYGQPPSRGSYPGQNEAICLEQKDVYSISACAVHVVTIGTNKTIP
jgi:hypothetical protein